MNYEFKMLQHFSSLPYLIRKEFLQLRRNPFLPKLFVGFPLALMLVFPWAANQEVRDVKVSVVDLDHTVASRQLTQRIDASTYFTLADYAPSYDAALRDVQHGDADIILQVEPGYERHQAQGQPARLQVSANAVNGTRGTLGSAYLRQLLATPNPAQGSSVSSSPSLGSTVTSSPTQGSTVTSRYLFNPTLDYKRFMVPALMVMLITLLGGFLPALNIVGEKEAGTIEQINVTPVSRIEFIMGKLIPYWIICFLLLNLSMLIAWGVYGIVPAGSLLTIYGFTTLYILLISAFGLLISNFSDTMQQAMFVMFFFMLIFLLMSGLFTPVTSMPTWAQWIAAFNPLKYFMEVMRMVYLKGCGIQHLTRQLLALTAFALVFVTAAIRTYRKNN